MMNRMNPGMAANETRARRVAKARKAWCVMPCALVILLAAGMLNFAMLSAHSEQGGSSTVQPEEVELRGKVVCIPELMHALYQTELPAEHEHVYGFRTSDGSVYTLLRTKFSDALFIDERLRQKDLLLKGQVYPKSHIFEPMRLRSVRNGTVYDLYYYCNVCSIETVSAGPCACCQGPVQLMERPLKNEKAVPEKRP